ncbi:MAG TPA: SRPBCC family protein [Gemmatimonadaceae bacterium]
MDTDSRPAGRLERQKPNEMTNTGEIRREPFVLHAPSRHARMRTVDERFVRSRLATIFQLALDVERWPQLLPHYRFVRFRERTSDDGGIVEMSANRPFGPFNWPTWWVSQMSVQRKALRGGDEPLVRFRHIEGITTGMDVEWSFHPDKGGTKVRLVHAWNGPPWPVVGGVAAANVIGPVFVHGIASRTLEGLARIAEQEPI